MLDLNTGSDSRESSTEGYTVYPDVDTRPVLDRLRNGRTRMEVSFLIALENIPELQETENGVPNIQEVLEYATSSYDEIEELLDGRPWTNYYVDPSFYARSLGIVDFYSEGRDG